MGEADPDFGDPAGEAGWIADQFEAQIVLVPDAGHYPHRDYPDVVNPPLVRFCHEATTG